ncbi:MAG: NAD(+) synthase, partial [Patescibacteria group bacterium]
GLSGGVDSSLVLKLAVDALGPENVTGILMPELGLTKPENVDHAKTLAAYFGIDTYYQPINTFLLDMKILPWGATTLSHMNAKARIRALLLYSYANVENALVLGTSNKSECLLGYGTKYGDLACDIQVIASLFKTDVVRLAEFVGLPPEIAHKTPSAELAQGQTDEGDLGASYDHLDQVLRLLDLGVQECIDKGFPATLVHKVFDAWHANKHKGSTPPIIKI